MASEPQRELNFVNREARTDAQPVLLSWSGGKDSALALDRLRQDSAFRVIGLLTTLTPRYARISMHGVRRELLQRQAEALGLLVHEIRIDPRSSNEDYEAAWRTALARLPGNTSEARCIAFGDIFLADVRAYREQMAAELGFRPVFPLWGQSTVLLAQEVVNRGFAARVVCVDTHMLDVSFAGRAFDAAFLDALPESIDPCGERGEFHTFVSDGPGFLHAVPCTVGETVMREDRFAFCDLVPVDVAPAQRKRSIAL
jgi:uncharacterized protein (TIGR00290 family)